MMIQCIELQCSSLLLQFLKFYLTHGPDGAFFHQNPKLQGLGRQFGALSNDLTALNILVLRDPCPLINYYFYKKLSLYIQTQLIIWDLN